MLKAIKIDPENKEISIVDLNDYAKDYTAISKAIGCQYFTMACDLPNNDTLYVDDEGLFNSDNSFFQLSHGHQPYAGVGILVHTDKEGLTQPVQSTLESIKKDVLFISKNSIR